MRKRIPICACACFLSSVLLFSCQAERKTSYSHSKASGSSDKQIADNNKTGAQHNKTAPKNYYIANKNITKAPVKPAAVTQAPAAVAPEVAPAPVVVNTPPAEVSQQRAEVPKLPPVTFIIKDSVLPKDPTLVAVTKPDTIQIKTPTKDESAEAEPAPSDEITPLTAEEMDTVLSRYAEMLSVDRSEMANFNLYFFINEWYGTKYKYGGTDSTGIDCSAFSQKLYGKVYGVEILRTARQQHKHCERVKYPDDATEGDLLFFRVHHVRVSHVGVYLANGYFAHSSSSHGVVISNLHNKYWRRRFAGCGRVPREEKSITESDYIQ